MKKLLILYILTNAYLPLQAQEKHNTPITKIEIDTLKKREKDLWYADDVPPDVRKAQKALEDSLRKASLKQKPKREDGREEVFQGFDIPVWIFTLLKWLFYGVLLFGVLMLILKGNFNFSFTPKNNKVDEIISETTAIESAEQLKSIGYEDQIQRAEEQGNYRLAIRLYYLWTLKKLIDGDLIQFHIKKTNRDYCQELAGKTVFDDFSQCTQYYNYVWFGEFNVDNSMYAKIKIQFKTLLNQL
ncbi:MAG: hypothetical protein U5N85_19475 [Arcicella sp.]|nr:hypothetical protein [Arcicella sp.]